MQECHLVVGNKVEWEWLEARKVKLLVIVFCNFHMYITFSSGKCWFFAVKCVSNLWGGGVGGVQCVLTVF